MVPPVFEGGMTFWILLVPLHCLHFEGMTSSLHFLYIVRLLSKPLFPCSSLFTHTATAFLLPVLHVKDLWRFRARSFHATKSIVYPFWQIFKPFWRCIPLSNVTLTSPYQSKQYTSSSSSAWRLLSWSPKLSASCWKLTNKIKRDPLTSIHYFSDPKTSNF